MCIYGSTLGSTDRLSKRYQFTWPVMDLVVFVVVLDVNTNCFNRKVLKIAACSSSRSMSMQQQN